MPLPFYQETLLAKPLALKELAKPSEGDNSDKAGSTKNILALKAGQKLPGGTRSTHQLVSGALGKTVPSWLSRRKLGIDRSNAWESV